MRRYLRRSGADIGLLPVASTCSACRWRFGLRHRRQAARRHPVPPFRALQGLRRLPARLRRMAARPAQGSALPPDAAQSGASARSCRSTRSFRRTPPTHYGHGEQGAGTCPIRRIRQPIGRHRGLGRHRASRPHRLPAVRLPHGAQGPADGARCARACCRRGSPPASPCCSPAASILRSASAHRDAPRRAGPRAARVVAAHRRSAARSRRARQSGRRRARHPGALSTLRRLERRAAVGRARRPAGAGPGVRPGRPPDARSSPGPGRRFVGSRQACVRRNRAHGHSVGTVVIHRCRRRGRLRGIHRHRRASPPTVLAADHNAQSPLDHNTVAGTTWRIAPYRRAPVEREPQSTSASNRARARSRSANPGAIDDPADKAASTRIRAGAGGRTSRRRSSAPHGDGRRRMPSSAPARRQCTGTFGASTGASQASSSCSARCSASTSCILPAPIALARSAISTPRSAARCSAGC